MTPRSIPLPAVRGDSFFRTSWPASCLDYEVSLCSIASPERKTGNTIPFASPVAIKEMCPCASLSLVAPLWAVPRPLAM